MELLSWQIFLSSTCTKMNMAPNLFTFRNLFQWINLLFTKWTEMMVWLITQIAFDVHTNVLLFKQTANFLAQFWVKI